MSKVEKVVDAPMIVILKELQSELRNGKLKDVIDRGDNIAVTCPIHKGGFENKPSCMVYANKNNRVEYGQTHCFVCNYSAKLPRFIEDCFGEQDGFGKEWLEERYGDIFIDKPIEFPIFGETEEKKEQNYLDESILNEFDYYHPYMWKRKLTKDVVDKFHVGYDKKHKSITFPVWDDKGNLVMITERSVLSKHFFIPNGVQKPVYLLNFIKKENIKTVMVVESQLNALTAWSYGIPAVALFGTGSSYQYDILKKSGIRSYILCFDGDEAGRKGAKRFMQNMKKNVFITDMEMPLGKDVNDMEKDEFLNLLKSYGIEYGG